MTESILEDLVRNFTSTGTVITYLAYPLRSLLRIRPLAVSIIQTVLQGRVIGPSPNPQPGGPG